MCDFWWTKWHWDQSFSGYFGFQCQQCSMLIFIYKVLLPEGQTVEAWEPSKNNGLSEIREHWIQKYFHLSLND
jgi:hypothetical protein